MFIAVGCFVPGFGFPGFHAEFVNFIFRMSFFGRFSCVYCILEFSHEFFSCLFMRFSLF